METELQLGSLDLDLSQSTAQSSSEIALVPYAKVDGVWTLPDEFIWRVARQCQHERTFKTVFVDGQVRNEFDFMAVMKSPGNIPVFAFRDDEPLGFAWLNSASGKHAFGHFCMMRAAWGNESLKIGRLFVNYWLSFKNADGPVIDTIIGIFPECNARARRFVKALGFVFVGTIPRMLEDAYAGRRVGASICYYSRHA